MKINIKDNENLSSFFSFVSKTVIIIPVVIVILSLILKFNQTKTSINLSNDLNKGQSRLTPTIILIAQNNSFKFDLKGPIVCNNLFIKDKKILFKNILTNYLLNGDCLYTWETGKLNGEKKCGLSNYVSMAESYLGLLSVDDLINNNLVKDFTKNKGINIRDVISSCKKGEIKDKSIFKVPEKINFK